MNSIGRSSRFVARGILFAAFFVSLPGGQAANAQNVVGEEPNRGGDVDLKSVSPDVALENLVVADGYEVNLFASEKDFPLNNPVSMTWDSEGRMWVATMPSYPHLVPGEKPHDALLVLEDRDADGKADHHVTFADDLYLPGGFELGDGGAYVAGQPDLLFLKDTNGDGKADIRETVLHGFGTEDSHHAISAFTWGPGGALYFQEGTFHHSQVETPFGPVRLENAGVFRFEPKTFKLDVFVSYPFANPWGHVFDRWGQNFVADASGGSNYFGTAFSGHIDYPRKHRGMKVFTSVVRPTAGCEIVSSRQFPESAQGNFLVNNCIGFQGIKQHQMIEEGSGFTSKEVEPLLYSKDINFRPVDIQFGPDGALYIVDWFNPLIGHMQYSIRDPQRDHKHGRIWRIAAKNRPLLDRPNLSELSILELLEQLKTYEDRTRYCVRRELRERSDEEVASATQAWIQSLDSDDEAYEHWLLEALWVRQGAHAVDEELLDRVLASPEPKARAAAVRVLCYWREELPDALSRLRRAANDAHPRVRLEAVRACSFFRDAAAAEVALEIVNHPMDYYLDYTLTETLRQLEQYYVPALAAAEPFASNNLKGVSHLLRQVDLVLLSSMARSEPVCLALLLRANVAEEDRRDAIRRLAEMRHTDELAETLAAIDVVDAADGKEATAVLADLGKILVSTDARSLAANRDSLVRLATKARQPIVRRVGFATLLVVDGDVEEAHALASRAPETLADFLSAIPMVANADLREPLYQIVRPLVGGASSKTASPFAAVRHAAIDALTYLPGHDRDSFQALANLYEIGVDQSESVRALARLNLDTVPVDEIEQLARQVVRHVEASSTDERTSPEMLATIQLGKDLARRLPPTNAKPIQSALADLGVQLVSIRPVPKLVRFDRREIAVEAGKPVEIVFENIDVMQHNLVIAEPGAFDAVVVASMKLQLTPLEALAAGYIPNSPQILWATPLLQTGETARLKFVAPNAPGKYPFICTYPGHEKTMNGVMHVVSDLDAFLASYELPEAEIGHAERTAIVKDYTYEDLAPFVNWSDGSRSFANGKQLFAEMTCVNCHRLDGPDLVGPSLAREIEAKKYTVDLLLREMIDPSKTIADAFKQWVFIANGKAYSGMILNETDAYYLINEKPGVECAPTKIFKSDLDSDPLPSAVSVMPAKLLNTMTVSEIQDLLAYVQSKGNAEHQWFETNPPSKQGK